MPVYRFDGFSWRFDADLEPAGGANVEYFGDSVAVSGNTVMVGAKRSDDGHRFVDVYQSNGVSWRFQERLTPFDSRSGSLFGRLVHLRGDLAVIAASSGIGGPAEASALYVFRYDHGRWHLRAKLRDLESSSALGIAMAVGEDFVVAESLVSASERVHIFHGLSDCDGDGSPDFCRTDRGLALAADCDPDCVADVDCDDELACTGEEACVDGRCVPGGNPCADAPRGCLEPDAVCADCLTDADCDDGTFCNGVERCEQRMCVSSSRPCSNPALVCGEETRECEAASRLVQARLIESPPSQTGNLSASALATDGARVAVGMRWAAVAGLSSAGIVAVYRREGSDWTLDAILPNPDPRAYGSFGHALDMDGGYLLVGATGNSVPCTDDPADGSCGTAYLYRREAGDWVLDARIPAPSGSAGWTFGQGVALRGDTAFVSAPRNDHADEENQACNSGAVFVFHRQDETWSLEARLTSSEPLCNELFGYSIAIDDDRLVVGALQTPGGPAYSGSAYVYSRHGDSWEQAGRLRPAAPAENDGFGYAVAIDGSWIAVAARVQSGNTRRAGAAYVFRNEPGGDEPWMLGARLTPADTNDGDDFGVSLALRGNLLAVGAARDDVDGTRDAGSAHLFEWHDSDWHWTGKVVATPLTEYDNSGSGLLFTGAALVSSVQQLRTPSGARAALAVYQGISDCNANGVLDLLDVHDGTSADENEDGLPDECTAGACCRGGACVEVDAAAECGADDFVCDVAELLPPTFAGCYGDVDGNGTVNPGDRGFVSAAIGHDEPETVCTFDLDGNGTINAADRGFAAANVGRCEPLPDWQNGSGLNHGQVDPRLPRAEFLGIATTCATAECP